MKYNFLFLIFSLFFIFQINSQNFGEVKNKENCLKKIKSSSNTTNSIEAEFSELKYSSLFKNPIIGNGYFYFQKKNNIRWEQKKPSKNIILISNGKIKIQENGKEIKNVASNKIANKIQDLMLQLISGDFLKQNEFNINFLENKSIYKLILTPKNKRLKKYIAKIELFFDKENGFCKELIFYENESNFTRYTFLNQKFNQEISNSLFINF